MATFAVDPKIAHVHILGAVAGVASGSEFLLCDDGRVTGMTIYFGMLTEQGKFGIAVVIEFLRLPRDRTVALAALIAHTRGMPVVGRMAAVAVLRNLVLHAACFVARQAVEVGMRAFERELGFLEMIELRSAPTCGSVALITLGAASAGVRIVGRVA